MLYSFSNLNFFLWNLKSAVKKWLARLLIMGKVGCARLAVIWISKSSL
jgi:hypothetical protein